MLIRLCHVACLMALCLLPTVGQSQTAPLGPPHKRPVIDPNRRHASFEVPKYYSIVGLGSSEPDTLVKLPHPTAILQLHDTAHTSLVVRFPNLGLLSDIEDTLQAPTAMLPDTAVTYQSHTPLCHLTSPKTPYGILVEVLDKATHRVLDSRLLKYDMEVVKFKQRPIVITHAPTAGYDNKSLRRRFYPKILPLVLETNPGWVCFETLDTNGTYSLDFREPKDTSHMTMLLVMRPANVGKISNADWEKFKTSAREAYGKRGIAIATIGDFDVDDKASRKILKKCYEFVSTRYEGAYSYITTYLTAHTIFLMTSLIDPTDTDLSYAYCRAVARTLRVPTNGR